MMLQSKVFDPTLSHTECIWGFFYICFSLFNAHLKLYTTVNLSIIALGPLIIDSSHFRLSEPNWGTQKDVW